MVRTKMITEFTLDQKLLGVFFLGGGGGGGGEEEELCRFIILYTDLFTCMILVCKKKRVQYSLSGAFYDCMLAW